MKMDTQMLTYIKNKLIFISSSRLYLGGLYLALIPIFALIYTYIIPNDFYHSTIRHEKGTDALLSTISSNIKTMFIENIKNEATKHNSSYIRLQYDRLRLLDHINEELKESKYKVPKVLPPLKNFRRYLVGDIYVFEEIKDGADYDLREKNIIESVQLDLNKMSIKNIQFKDMKLKDTITFEVEFFPDYKYYKLHHYKRRIDLSDSIPSPQGVSLKVLSLDFTDRAKKQPQLLKCELNLYYSAFVCETFSTSFSNASKKLFGE